MAIRNWGLGQLLVFWVAGVTIMWIAYRTPVYSYLPLIDYGFSTSFGRGAHADSLHVDVRADYALRLIRIHLEVGARSNGTKAELG